MLAQLNFGQKILLARELYEECLTARIEYESLLRRPFQWRGIRTPPELDTFLKILFPDDEIQKEADGVWRIYLAASKKVRDQEAAIVLAMRTFDAAFRHLVYGSDWWHAQDTLSRLRECLTRLREAQGRVVYFLNRSRRISLGLFDYDTRAFFELRYEALFQWMRSNLRLVRVLIHAIEGATAPPSDPPPMPIGS